ncbi:hypothetical protein MBT84_45840 [Streptomyces sp. MBT84]|nr:hypothetical protein [Streptomyces sp. MBT84]
MCTPSWEAMTPPTAAGLTQADRVKGLDSDSAALEVIALVAVPSRARLEEKKSLSSVSQVAPVPLPVRFSPPAVSAALVALPSVASVSAQL